MKPALVFLGSPSLKAFRFFRGIERKCLTTMNKSAELPEHNGQKCGFSGKVGCDLQFLQKLTFSSHLQSLLLSLTRISNCQHTLGLDLAVDNPRFFLSVLDFFSAAGPAFGALCCFCFLEWPPGPAPATAILLMRTRGFVAILPAAASNSLNPRNLNPAQFHQCGRLLSLV